MSAELETCDLTPVPLRDEPDTEVEGKGRSENFNMDLEQPIFSALSVLQDGTHSAKEDLSLISGNKTAATLAVVTTSDSESGIFAGESEHCVEHEAELGWFCSSEQKLICSQCAIVGPCQGHSVTPVASRVTTVRVSALTSPDNRTEPLQMCY